MQAAQLYYNVHCPAEYVTVQCGVQTGAARSAMQGCLDPGLLKIYTALAVQQLTAQVSQCDATRVILEYLAALARLAAALPSDQAPADLRVQRSPLWPCSQPNLLPSSTDLITPPPQDAAIRPVRSPATHDGVVSKSEVTTAAGLAPQPSSGGAPPPMPVTRAQAFQVLDFLVVPPEGLAWAVLSDTCKPIRERQAAMGLLTAVYQSNCSSVTTDADHVAYCTKFHFTAFRSAYSEEDVAQCCQHLEALQMLAKCKVGPTGLMQLITQVMRP